MKFKSFCLFSLLLFSTLLQASIFHDLIDPDREHAHFAVQMSTDSLGLAYYNDHHGLGYVAGFDVGPYQWHKVEGRDWDTWD